MREKISVAEQEPVEPKLFEDLEPEPKLNFDYPLFAVSFEDARMKKKTNFYLY